MLHLTEDKVFTSRAMNNFFKKRSSFFFLSFFFCFFLFISACSKPHPRPEELDPIYSDLQKELVETKASLEQEKKTYEEHLLTLKKVVPQSGQIKYAIKRVRESEERMNLLKQKITFFELKIISRKHFDRENYLDAYNKKEAWPKENEFQEYKSQKKFEKAPRKWSYENRISELGIKRKPSSKQTAGDSSSEKAGKKNKEEQSASNEAPPTNPSH